jgi:hypothetical protein
LTWIDAPDMKRSPFPAARRPARRAAVFASFIAVVALSGQLVVAVPAYAAPMSETEKIDALLNDVEAHNDLKFIRLGSVHSSGEAAQMLRIKLRFAGSRVKTADDFIEHIASATESGHPYLVVYPDGRKVQSGTFLRAELKRLTALQADARAKR